VAVTVQNLIDRIKWVADNGTGNRLLSDDLIPEIDDAYKEAWEAIVEQYDDYFVKKVTDFAIAGGVGANTYTISATDFFKLKAIQLQVGLTFAPPLPAHGMNEMGSAPELSYRLVDGTVYFEPELSCAGTYRLWYIYTPPDLVNTSDSITDLNGAVRRFVIDAVATRAVLRESDADVAMMKALRDEMMERLRRASAQRNAGKGRRVARTRTTRRRALARTKTGYYLP
jgi:hypothetical protein